MTFFFLKQYPVSLLKMYFKRKLVPNLKYHRQMTGLPVSGRLMGFKKFGGEKAGV